MKIYTKTGDLGQTGLFGGPRVFKDNTRICAYGSVDELNATLGLATCEPSQRTSDLIDLLRRLQHDLFCIGAELATPDPNRNPVPGIHAERISQLEQQIDAFESELAPLRQFILPGGCKLAASLHVARTVCRRAERDVVHLQQVDGEFVAANVICYLNRLSDLLFVMARVSNAREGIADVPWDVRS